MSMAKLIQGLRPYLGPEGADAVVEALENWMSDERRETLSRADERVAARYESIHRRVHEDIAGVEIRLTKSMAELESRVSKTMADVESRLTTRMADLEAKTAHAMADLESRLTIRMANLESRLETRMTALESRVIRWVVTALILNTGLMLATGWAAKHLF